MDIELREILDKVYANEMKPDEAQWKICILFFSGSAWVAETRECGNCKHFKLDAGANIMGTCSKKLMTVLSDMFINYKKEDGTCFE